MSWLHWRRPETLDEVHEAVAAEIDGYGRNLDALYDVLTGYPVAGVVWHDAGPSRRVLGADGVRLQAVLDDARKARPSLVIAKVWP